ncbi:class I adenylate-forming enzyme family protein [Tannockella kyphosi]|uniref:class I adenylate-forming enzyme family protein n=1 Tax=Tannockella kyphosi TaxID=2899121 RepID=UPI00201340BE|nr:class I adenylate-forming enzyme family protein [Tannockella kyphosi]
MNKSIVECIRNHAISTPNKLAIIDVKIELTYQEYWDKINIAASYLLEIGVKDNECIVVKNSQSVPYLVLVHAIQLINGIVVPLEKSVNVGRVQEILKETKATKFFGDMKIDGYDCYCIEDAYNYTGVVNTFDISNMVGDSMILFTTGTTGKSKGIVLEYLAEVAVGENVMYGVEMKKDNVEIIPMPMNHSFSLRRYFANMINGSTVIVLDGVFFVKIVFNMIEKYKVTALAMAPAAMSIIFKLTRDRIANYADQLDYIQFGSAPIPEVDKEHLLQIVPNVRLYNIYGSTEVGCACILNFNSKDNKQSCIGYPGVHSQFRIVDENGGEMEDASLENPGYISYTGGMKMKCYYNEPELTNKTIINGYLQSSDLGYKDEEGRIYMLGRADDVIITGGNKVSPLEVEELALQIEGVNDCICKGRPTMIFQEKNDKKLNFF